MAGKPKENVQNTAEVMCTKPVKSLDRKTGKPSFSSAKEEAGRGLQVAQTLMWKGWSGAS